MWSGWSGEEGLRCVGCVRLIGYRSEGVGSIYVLMEAHSNTVWHVGGECA